MKKIGFALGLVVAFCLVISSAWAASPDAIVGKWLNGKQTAHVEIYKAEGKYYGKIVWLKEPVYPADDKKGMAGKQKVDRENSGCCKAQPAHPGPGHSPGFRFREGRPLGKRDDL